MTMTIEQVIIDLTAHINNIPTRIQEIPVEELLQKPAPGKWSKKEILGHLIDSAINNLKRFVDIQSQPQPYKVLRYMQDNLVAINRYQDLPLDHMLLLWKLLNQQIVYVISSIPAEKLSYKIIIPSGESKTLEWLVIDYIEHMDHHWGQVFGG
ncbi:DinB family protein [Pseudoflavitalea sp. X16]|uniref:DinB family protein n=1 Tax=Paraflavitalea devenefica TaxID=2716334 RepID=UPI001424A34E|nr:DinB family protein [Paraflavitalea devenefica]NII25114.1 DinB family protein [Paraflavitalea devenefica]